MKFLKRIIFPFIMLGRIIKFNLNLPLKLVFHSPHRNGKWFVKFDEYPGPVENLEMVAGADKLCEDMFNGVLYDRDENKPHEITVNIVQAFTERKPGSYKLKLIPSDTSVWDGRFYEAYVWNTGKKDWEMKRLIWLCPVMLYTFGCYPKRLYLWRQN